MTRTDALDAMIREALALRKRGLMRDLDGNVVKVGKAKENVTVRKSIFRDIIAPEGKPKDAQELKDLDVDRVDGVDKPATGRNFLLFKKEDGPRPYGEPDERDTDEMDDAERRARGVAPLSGRKFKVSFADTLFGDPSRHAVREFPIESQPTRGPRAADTGEDALGREYADAVLERLGGGASHGAPDVSPIPVAGAGERWEGDTRDLANAPQRFIPRGAGDAGRVGSEDRGVRPVNPNLDADGAYTLREIGELDSVATRVGPNFVLSPVDPGIAPASAFIAPQPATSVRKGVKSGLFTSAILGRHGDQADGFLG